MSVGFTGQADDYSGPAAIGDHGRPVAFLSTATNPVPGGFSGLAEVFVR